MTRESKCTGCSKAYTCSNYESKPEDAKCWTEDEAGFIERGSAVATETPFGSLYNPTVSEETFYGKRVKKDEYLRDIDC